jgi:hypothetical protein
MLAVTDESQPAEGSLRSKSRFLLGGAAWIVITVCVEAGVGWVMVGVGQPLFPVVATITGIAALVACIALIVLSHSRELPSRFCSRVISCLVVLCVCMWVLGVWWGVDGAPAVRVSGWNAELVQLATCAKSPEGFCPPGSQRNVPGLGNAPRAVTVPGTSYVVLGGTRGYLYAPGASTAQAAQAEYCVRHIYGPWFEYMQGSLEGGCSWGYHFDLMG